MTLKKQYKISSIYKKHSLQHVNPYWVSGICDGEACFSISLNLNKSLNIGIQVRPSFSISQNIKSFNAINSIKDFFMVGFIRKSLKDNTIKYETRSLSVIINKIITHFEIFINSKS